MDNEERLIKEKELKSAEELHRFEAGIMLGQTAVYIIATGSLLNAIIEEPNDILYISKLCICVFGIVLSFIFFIITYRSGQNVRYSRKRATELSEELGYRLYRAEYRARAYKVFSGTAMTRAVSVLGGIIWIITLLKIALF